MCGKFTQMMSWGAYVSLADLLAGESSSGDSRSEVVSPMRDAFVVRLNPGRVRETARMRWGLVPWWAKDPGIATRCIHARAETINTAKPYCDAFRFRRGLIIASELLVRRRKPDSPS